MNDTNLEKALGEKAKDTARKTGKNVLNKFKNLFVKNLFFRRIFITIAIISILIIFLASALKSIFHIDTAGGGSGGGGSGTKARVPAAFQDVTKSAGVSTNIKSTSSSSGSNVNSGIINIDNSGTEEEQIQRRIIACAQACHQYLRENGYIYGDADDGFPGMVIPDGIYNPPRPEKGKEIDCSSYVSWVMYTAGYDSFATWQENDFVANSSKHGLIEVPLTDVRAGDIIHEPGHIEIVAEVVEGTITRVYNCGGKESIQDSGTAEVPESSPDGGGADHVLRPKKLGGAIHQINGASTINVNIAEDKMFFIGDSWMEGLQGSGKAKSLNSYFYAKGGENADWVLNNYADMQSKMPNDVSCIIVGFGLNGTYNWSKTQELIDKLTSDYSNINIFVLQTPHICDGYTIYPNFNADIDRYNENMEKYCSEKTEVTFIKPNINIVSDNGQGYLKNEYALDSNDTSMGGGKIHLNGEGYEVWYKDIVSLVQGLGFGGYSGTGVQSSTNISGHIVSNDRGGYKVDIDLDKKIEEVMKQLDEEGNNPLRNYLSDKNRIEYLKAFLKASIVTSYPDLRQKSEIGQNVPDDEVQGIIKIRRKTQSTPENNPGEYLQYIPEDQYNQLKQGNDNSIFNYYTIDRSGQIVVAGYEKKTSDQQKENKGGDPRPDDVQNEAEDDMYTITDAKINYTQQVERYVMPFDLLWSLLVYSSDEDFTYDLANLVTEGEIIITVCDNITQKNKTDEYTFDKNVKLTEHATFKDTTQNPPKAPDRKYSGDRPDEDYTYTIINKSYYESNTPSISVTYADTWAMKYEAKVQKKNDTNTNTVNTTEEDDNSYRDGGEESIAQSASDTLLSGWKKDYEDVLKNAYKEDIQRRNEEIQTQKEEKEKESTKTSNDKQSASSSKQQNQEELKPFEVKYSINDLKLKYRNKYINKKRKVTTVTTEKKYIVQPGNTEGKDDPDDTNENFVTLLKKHSKAYNSLDSDKGWLFDSMKAQESICDMVDLIKYLFQKTYDIDLDMDYFDFEEYGSSKFRNVSSGSGKLSVLSQYIAYWENDPMRRYLLKGDVAYNSDERIYRCITEDKQYYIMQDDLNTGNGNRNFGFGVCFWVGYSKSWIEDNVKYFAAEGINIKDSQYQVEGKSKLPVDLVNRIKEKIVVFLKNDVSEALSNRGITLEDYQVDALVNCRYRGAIKYSALDVYKQYGLSEQFKNAVEDFSNGTDRANANWTLFTTGRYTNGYGQDIEIY